MSSKTSLALFITALVLMLASAQPAQAQHRHQQQQQHWQYNYQWQQRSWSVQPYYAPQVYAPPTVYYTPPPVYYVQPQMVYNCYESVTREFWHEGPCNGRETQYNRLGE